MLGVAWGVGAVYLAVLRTFPQLLEPENLARARAFLEAWGKASGLTAAVLMGITVSIYGWLPDRQTYPGLRRLLGWLWWEGVGAVVIGLGIGVRGLFYKMRTGVQARLGRDGRRFLRNGGALPRRRYGEVRRLDAPRAVSAGKVVLLAVLVALVGTGCFVPIASSPKVRVAHSPLAPVSGKREGSVVLRETTNSASQHWGIIGGKAAEASDLIHLFAPFAMPATCIEMEGGQSLHEVMRSFLTDSLQQAGYTVLVHKVAGKPLSKKWRGAYPIVEFDLKEFRYEYGARKPEPNSHTIDLTLRLRDRDGITELWTKRYQTVVRNRRNYGEATIRQALDEVLNQAVADFVAEEFWEKVRTSEGGFPTGIRN